MLELEPNRTIALGLVIQSSPSSERWKSGDDDSEPEFTGCGLVLMSLSDSGNGGSLEGGG